MAERFLSSHPSDSVIVAVFTTILGFPMFRLMWNGYAETGRIVTHYSSRAGYTFGSPLWVLVPLWCLLCTCWFLVRGFVIRIEVDSVGITAFGLRGRKVSLAWQDVTAFRRGIRRTFAGQSTFNDVPVYRVEGMSGAIIFDETWPRRSELIKTVHENLPPMAVNEVPLLTAEVSR